MNFKLLMTRINSQTAGWHADKTRGRVFRGRNRAMKGRLKIARWHVALVLALCTSFPSLADNIFVTTANDNTILEFNSIGNESTFATAASGLSYPLGLAFDNSGNLFIANAGNNTIEEFKPGGTGTVFATASDGLDEPQGDERVHIGSGRAADRGR